MKKRKGLWVGGAIVMAVALFAAVAFLIGYNSTDARIDAPAFWEGAGCPKT